jgi:hypothetical protein
MQHSSSTSELFPCKRNLFTNVTEAIEKNPIGHNCARDLGIYYNQSVPPILLICNEYSLSPSTETEGSFNLLFFLYMAFQTLLLLLYIIYRTVKIRAQKDGPYTSVESGYPTTTFLKRDSESGIPSNLFFAGYKNDGFGYCV